MSSDFKDPRHEQRDSLSKIKVLLEQFRSTLQPNSAILSDIDNAIAKLEAAIEKVSNQIDEAEKDLFAELEEEDKPKDKWYNFFN
jgi:predicted  nucleic acid-binding Zn-ribbon protein